ncbi:hypothetical protein sS8_2558 [Methylocaldum marinum]|uniref:Uncharacterized protein n=1 Tax=Methylocaldum marinum TaxID=1432792 RepID=A0A250KXL1_9GAMM|nr:hypothetical protein sS8_2558 [Methylocaldum marinum]
MNIIISGQSLYEFRRIIPNAGCLGKVGGEAANILDQNRVWVDDIDNLQITFKKLVPGVVVLSSASR